MSKRKKHAQGATAVDHDELSSDLLAESDAASVDDGVSALDPGEDERVYIVVGADEPVQTARPRDLLTLMKAWRHGRATRTLGDALSDGYVAVICIAVFGAMIVNLVLKTQRNVSACATAECSAARTILPWVGAAAIGALALAFSHLFGPVLASAAEGFWLLDAPVDRRRILAKRLAGVIAGAAGVGLLAGALVALLTGSGWGGILVWGLACGLFAGGLVALAAAVQTLEHTRALRWLQTVLSAIAIAALVAVTAIAARWIVVGSLGAGALLIPGSIGVLGLVLLVAGAVVAAGRLNRLKRARLVSGGSLVTGMQGAMFALDFGLMRDILVERDARDRGHVRPRAGRGIGTTALVWRDVQRLWRFPKPLLSIIVTIVVPYALVALGLGVLAPFVAGLVLCVVLVPTMGQLRVLTRTPGLARLMPFTMSQLKTAAIVVPGVLALLWSVAVVPAYVGLGSGVVHHSLFDAIVLALVTGIAGLNGAIRWTGARQINFETPMLATGAGAVPPSMIFNLIRGLDMVALTTALVIFGVKPYWSLAIGVITLLFLRAGGMSREELEEKQKQAQRELDAEKAARQQEKIKIKR